MLFNFLQQVPVETTRYMVAGYTVIFGIMFLYIASLIVRTRRLKQELQTFEELDQEQK